MRIEVGVQTDVGRVREGNEDAFAIEPPLYAVADGMGGHRGGEVASQLVIAALAHVFVSASLAEMGDSSPDRASLLFRAQFRC